jgi:hypothetical protein
MDLADIFKGKAAEIFYRIVPLLGLVPSEKRARNVWCEYQRALLIGKKIEQPWPGVKVREFGGKLVIFRGELEAAANDVIGPLPTPEYKNTAENNVGKRRRGRPRKMAAEG